MNNASVRVDAPGVRKIMGRLGVLIAMASAVAIAAIAILFASLIPEGTSSSASVSVRAGVLWFTTGGLALLVAATLVARMKLRTRRVARAATPIVAEAPAPVPA